MLLITLQKSEVHADASGYYILTYKYIYFILQYFLVKLKKISHDTTVDDKTDVYIMVVISLWNTRRTNIMLSLSDFGLAKHTNSHC